MRTLFALLGLVALNGCATNFEPSPLPADHPASVDAQEAPRSRMERLVATDALTRKTRTQLLRNELPKPSFESNGMSHDMGAMQGMDHSKMKAMTAPAPDPSPAAEPLPMTTIYTCVMHSEVQQPTPGNCPKCGMTLVKKETRAP